jgi:hypothetical protein
MTAPPKQKAPPQYDPPRTPPTAKHSFGATSSVSATQLTLALIALGALLRVARYLSDRSVWLDESFLAINLSTRSYTDLFRTLDFNQGGPIGFLALEKAAIDLFGDGERSLRLFPFLAGLLSLPLFYVVARRTVSERPALLAVLFFVVSEGFIYYSAEAKQYAFDIVVGLGLFALYIIAVDRRRADAWLTALIGLAGAAAIWLSHPAVFLLVGFAFGWTLAAFVRGDRRLLVHQGAAYVVWLISFAVSYLVAIRDLRGLQETLAGHGNDGLVSGRATLVKPIYLIFSEPGGIPRTAAGLAFLVAIVGAVAIALTRWDRFAFFAMAGGSMLVAAFLGLYPIAPRFLLFLLPFAFICLAQGTFRLVSSSSLAVSVPAAVVLSALIVLPPTGNAIRHSFSPPGGQQMEALTARVSERWREGDTLYVFYASQYALRYYLFCRDCNPHSNRERALWPVRTSEGSSDQFAPALISDSPAVVLGRAYPDPRLNYLRDIEVLGGKRRVWFLFTHLSPLGWNDVLPPLDLQGKQIECLYAGASRACLYDLSRPPEPAQSP